MKLFVAGLPLDMDEHELKEIFGDYGTVHSANIILDRGTRTSRGFGFVEFATAASATEAMSALHGATIEGRPLTVKPALDKPRSGKGEGSRKNQPVGKRGGDR